MSKCFNVSKYPYLFSLILLMLLLTGCNKTSSPIPPQTLHIPTASSSGALYQLGDLFSTLWTNELSYITANSYESNGGIENLTLLHQGDAEVTFAVTSILYEAYHGIGDFEEKANDNLRVIAGLYYNPNQIVVSKDTNAKFLTDLKGLSFSPGAIGSTTIKEATQHFKVLGIDLAEYCDLVNSGFTESVELLKNNDIKGAWIMAGIPNQAVSQMTSEAGAHLISISDLTITQLQQNYPWYSKYIIPAGTYENQDTDITTSAVKLALCTTTDLDVQTVYDLTKTLWEHMDSLKEKNSTLRSVSLEGAVTDLAGLPLHDGAMKYYKEKGIIK
ncbi:TAXI family TRAP transporter solute-binding subunit [Lachnoclostridium phytofermentans]|uniref:TAXI family TRAP transporter solute-binding subunit n=1 Tax=Lachnoclostridium phytofermentans TaxID=66219 RepID=UPI00068AD538|nr:TAXI family TRAP transporter solute-binding subunit [Lachnoclostridium phytofermentans]